MNKSGMPPKLYRNVAIVVLHKLAPKFFTLYRLADIFGITKQTGHEIWHRDKDKYSEELIHRGGLDT